MFKNKRNSFLIWLGGLSAMALAIILLKKSGFLLVQTKWVDWTLELKPEFSDEEKYRLRKIIEEALLQPVAKPALQTPGAARVKSGDVSISEDADSNTMRVMLSSTRCRFCLIAPKPGGKKISPPVLPNIEEWVDRIWETIYDLNDPDRIVSKRII